MYRSDAQLHRAFAARRPEVLTTIADYRYLAPARIAAQERLETGLARYARLRDGGTVEPRQEPFRRRLGLWVVRLGTWLGGAATPPVSASGKPAAAPLGIPGS